MNSTTPKPTYLKDYQPSNFLIETTTLRVDLYEDYTRVAAQLQIRRNPDAAEEMPLVLNGENMELKSIAIDGVPLTAAQYQLTPTTLTIHNVPEHFALATEVIIKPQENTRLSGLYKSNGNFCTQCESHGFRFITYFLDRPDVLSRFTTTISADKKAYPVLLSNGNLTDSSDLPDNRHWVTWVDPTLKPSYLFALVAGNLDVLRDTYTTRSGRTIKLYAYTEYGKRDSAVYAMESLKEAMQWDEEKYGREYDLDIFMIVGVSDFNFGAMENKGLNIFNDKYILAQAETATDEDFIAIKNVVGHEYFHNWSGNRVTVRDWFQITLKEGLTVFRDQQFTAEKTFPVAKRIQEARGIRNFQFVQDGGPMAHPIYPDSYIEINNFYTVTVYEKGAEVIRMIHTILGEKTFRNAMDLYFSRHDGHPATTRDFVQAMQDASGVDFSQFWRWYKQAGTPTLQITSHYDAANRNYTLNVKQSCPPTPGQTVKEPFHIPLAIGLLNSDGEDLPLQLQGEDAPPVETTRVLNIKEAETSYQFVNIPSQPTPSLLRNFSAPVKLIYNYSDADYLFLMSHDSDLFNRWDATQQLATRILLKAITDIQQQRPPTEPKEFLSAFATLFKERKMDDVVLVEMLTLPAESYLLEQLEVADVDATHAAREWLRKLIAQTLRTDFLQYYQGNKALVAYQLDAAAIGKRRLKNLALAYLALLNDPAINQLCLQQFQQANNMSDTMGALTALNNIDCPERAQALTAFFERWQDQSLVVQKWFTLQAFSTLPNTLQVVKSLTQHPAFDMKNPNRVRSLIAAFATGNPTQFHAKTGEGYEFLANYVLAIDRYNPQLSARIVEPFTHWRKFDDERQQLMKKQLQRIIETKPLSNDVYEVASKSLQH